MKQSKNPAVALYLKASLASRRKIVLSVAYVFFTSLLEMAGISLIFPLLNDLGSEYVTLPYVDYSFPREDYLQYLLMFYFIRFSLIVAANRYIASLIYSLKYEFSKALFSSYIEMDFEDKARKDDAEIVRDLSNEINQLVNFVIIPVMIFMSESLVVLLLAGLCFVFYPLEFVSFILFISVPVLLYRGALRRHVASWGEQRMSLDSKLMKTVSQGLAGFVDIKVYDLSKNFLQEYEESLGGSTRLEAKQYFFAQLPRISLDTIFVVTVIAALLFVSDVKDQSSLYSTFGVAVLVGLRVLPSISRLAHCAQALRYGRGVLNLFARAAETAVVRGPSRRDWNILEVQDVAKNYKAKRVLSKISFSVGRGEKILITGPSGAGKSTLMNLVCGLIPVTEGDILVDGVGLSVGDAAWFDEIAYVKQHSYIIDADLAQNIVIDGDDFDVERLEYLVTALELDDLVDLPTLGENGSLISGGQRQRVSIARALYRKASLLLLDEPTSALHSTLAIKLRDMLLSTEGQTVICITHDTSWAPCFHRVVEISDVLEVKP